MTECLLKQDGLELEVHQSVHQYEVMAYYLELKHVMIIMLLMEKAAQAYAKSKLDGHVMA